MVQRLKRELRLLELSGTLHSHFRAVTADVRRHNGCTIQHLGGIHILVVLRQRARELNGLGLMQQDIGYPKRLHVVEELTLPHGKLVHVLQLRSLERLIHLQLSIFMQD